MDHFIRFTGPNDTIELFGVPLVGANAENGRKLLLSLALIAAVVLANWLLRRLSGLLLNGRGLARVVFWVKQAIGLFTAVVLIVGILSIWFNDPARLATALGLVSAGLAFALQKVVTAVAGYFVILRGKMFNVGDRIRMGGVRGDVIALGFIQTTVMEMGEPPAVQADDPAMWVRSRQYTGRIVTISNAKIFDEPVYNYTRDFPYIWEEMHLPVPYKADREVVERVLLDAARRHTLSWSDLSAEALHEMQRRYVVQPEDVTPRVYLRLTSNWLEMTVRFVVEDRGIRLVKDAMSREIIQALDAAGIEVGSTTFEVTGLPPLRIQDATRDGRHIG